MYWYANLLLKVKIPVFERAFEWIHFTIENSIKCNIHVVKIYNNTYTELSNSSAQFVYTDVEWSQRAHCMLQVVIQRIR